jgi:anti-sigma factor RsiW
MKTSGHPNDDARFDRLVDGELSETERGELLARLDDEPNGWRRCALAFLEAQCWKESFRGLEIEAAKQTQNAGAPEITPRPDKSAILRSRRLARLQTASAMAACLMLALLIGSLLPRDQVAPTTASTNATGGGQATQLASNHPEPTPEPLGQSADRQLAATHQAVSPDGPWRMVAVTPSDGQNKAQVMHLPAMERQNIDEAWLQKMPSAIPEDVLQALNRTGHQVQQRREVIPVPMKDGRRLMVPVDQVDVQYIGNGPY